MEIYLVGGAVRDKLLGLPVAEKDWVVVGSTPEEMVKLGYKPVGKDFPVFLHSKTGEEYALARTERKIGKGYKGFTFHTDPAVTLEEDLIRRDLTINAMAEDNAGNIFDPFHGQQDLKKKLLRHVSEAFVEDPVRILRVARFAARFGDFTVHEDTYKLMKRMVTNGEVDALVPERVWQELQRSLTLNFPHRFFEVLKKCGALKILFPEIERKYKETLTILKRAINKTKLPTIRFAALTSPLMENEITALCVKNKTPNEYRDLAVLTSDHKDDYYEINSLTNDQIILLLEQLDAYRRPNRFKEFLIACSIYFKDDNIQQQQKLIKALEITRKISAAEFIEEGLKGEQIRKALHKKRVAVVGG